MSRRRSRDFTQRTNPLDMIDIRIIPRGTRCHLWEHGKISEPHFIASGDIPVLVRTNYGPMYNLIKDMSTHEYSSWWEEAKETMKNLPFMKKYTHSQDTTIHTIYDMLADQYTDADAILMATSTDGRIALKFFDEGIMPDMLDLR